MPGAQIAYYFRVADNDGLHGPKWTKTAQVLWTFPELAQLNQQVNSEFAQMEKSLSNALEKAQGLKKELDEAMKRAQLGKEINQKTLDEIRQKDAELKKTLAELKALQDRWLGQTFSFQKPSELWMQKMADLQKLMEELSETEAPKNNPEIESSWQKSIQQKQQTEKNRALELKRLAQFYKDLKADKMLEDAIQGINEMAEKQEKLDLDQAKSAEELQKLAQEFRQHESALDELKTEKPENKEALDAMEPLEKEIEQDFEKLQKTKNSSDQKKTVQDLKKLAKSLEEQRTQSESMELDLNMNQ
jgi:chromosome segregation ATPase